MRFSKEFSFGPRLFAAGELGPAVERVCSRVFGTGYGVRASLCRTLHDGTQQDERESDTAVLSTVCDVREERISICLRFHKDHDNEQPSGAELTAWVYGEADGFLRVHVATHSVDRLSEFARVFQKELGLTSAPDSRARLEERMLRDHATDKARIFIGHGDSASWLSLKDFVVGRLALDYDEFNREPAAGYSTKERLQQMLNDTSFALLVMTAEDEHSDGTSHARENVIHEVGLFQGRHGFERAIVLLEDGCAEFSNIKGLTQIRFPKGDIMARSEEVRRVLEREGMLMKR